MAAVYLSQFFDQSYGHPAPHASLAVLGQLMWVRLGLMAVLSLRSMEDVRFSFVPLPGEWRIGVQFYAGFLPVGVAISYGLHFASFHPKPLDWWKFVPLLIGTFFAFLWVVALAEEFFFRAFLQRLLARSLHSETLGLIIASVLFGCAHLPFGIVSQLAIRDPGRRFGRFLRTGVLESAQRSGQHGDACAGGNHLAHVFHQLGFRIRLACPAACGRC